MPIKLKKSRSLAAVVWSPGSGQVSPSLAFREKTDDTSGEDNDEKEAVASKGRKTANSQGRRKGRITRSMANEANSEEAITPQQGAELGEVQAGEDGGPWSPALASELTVWPGANP